MRLPWAYKQLVGLLQAVEVPEIVGNQLYCAHLMVGWETLAMVSQGPSFIIMTIIFEEACITLLCY